ncbi:MAG: ribosomal protein [Candidatus Adlerbacteria bacterium]|nr:ribosomal protein [Candidatus Adlerbacteria bacterium]
MQVILRKDVRGLGRAHEVKNVAEGYAHNFLVPQGLAEIATPEKIAKLENASAADAAARKQAEDAQDSLVASLRSKSVTLTLKATEKGGLFKTVAPKDIAAAIKSQHNAEVQEAMIHMATPVKTVGEHTVELRSKSQKADLVVVVVAT